MASFKVELDDYFTQDGRSIRMPAGLKSDLESSLSSQIFTDQKIKSLFKEAKPNQTARFLFERGEVAIKLGDKIERLGRTSGSLRRRINRVSDYAQHVGVVPREPVLSQKGTQKTLAKMEARSSLGWVGKAFCLADLAGDTISLVRNSLSALSSSSSMRGFSDRLKYLNGGLWLFFGIKDLMEGVEERKEAQKIGDEEGNRRATAKVCGSSVLIAGSSLYLSSEIVGNLSSHSAEVAAMGIGHASNALFGVGALYGITMASLGILRCHNFGKAISSYLDNPDLSEEARLEGAIRFLRDSITVTPQERADLIYQVEREIPHASDQEKDQMLYKKMRDLTEVKVKYTKRRTSIRAICLILERSDQILAKLTHSRSEGMTEARELIHEVLSENKKKKTLYGIGLIAAIIGALGLIIGTVCSAGILPFVLSAVASSIYITLALAGLVVSAAKKDAETVGSSVIPLRSK